MDEETMAELWERFWDDDWCDDDMTRYLTKEAAADDGSSFCCGDSSGGVIGYVGFRENLTVISPGNYFTLY